MHLDGYGTVRYQYNPQLDNGFSSSLFSLNEFYNYKEGNHDEDSIQKYFHYYGQMNFGNIWVEAAMDGIETPFTTKAIYNKEDFTLLSEIGRAEAAKTALINMNVYVKVISLLTESSRLRNHHSAKTIRWSYSVVANTDGDDNPSQDSSCLHDSMKAGEIWDSAVAVYTGSLEKSDGYGNGYLLYGLADQLCIDFATCHHDSSSDSHHSKTTSKQNIELINLFQEGRTHLEHENCRSAQQTKNRIEQGMLVSLIQGTLRSSYRLQHSQDLRDENPEVYDKELGRAVAFAASILPDIHNCNPADAEIIDSNLKLSNLIVSSALNSRDAVSLFADIKDALERNYECLNVRCYEVGGLFDLDASTYFKGAEPCVHDNLHKKTLPEGIEKTTQRIQSSSQTKNKLGLMCFIFSIVGVALSLIIIKRKRRVAQAARKIEFALSGYSRASFSSPSPPPSSAFDFARHPYYSHLMDKDRISETNLYELVAV